MSEQPRLPVAGPWITDLEVEYVADAARNAWYASAGEWPARFEAGFARYVGREWAIAVPHCTAALHLVLAARGVGPGDEVVVPDATWIASAAAVEYVGATTVFADVDPLTWCLDVDALRAVLTDRTRAVIAVDLYGSMPDLDALQELCDDRGIDLVEDSAEAVGSQLRGRHAGSFGLASTFSFHGSKTLTTGEGGMLLGDDPELRERCLVLRDHGRPPGDRLFQNTEVAFKYRMSAVQAALGVAQLERVEQLVARKREIFAWYRDALDGLDGVVLNAEPEGVVNACWMVTAVVDASLGMDKFALMDALSQRGIDTRPFFSPLSSLEAYAGRPEAEAAAARNAVSYDIGFRAVNLPSALSLTRDDVGRVAAALRDVLAAARA